jgi:hypothetical protein
MPDLAAQSRPPYLSVALLSASALAYEILLMRLFTIIQWHHFAYMIIGLAMLGYGISGTFVSIFKQQLLINFNKIYIFCLIAFGVTSVAGYLLAQTVPFNAEEILWDPDQLIYLALMFLFLTIPFVLGATAICLCLMQYSSKVPRIYAADLFGAGIGSLMILFMLYWLFPQWILITIGASGVVASMLAAFELKLSYRKSLIISGTLLTTFLILAGSSIELKMSPYKSLMQAMRIDGAEIIAEKSSPLGYLSFLKNNKVPLRYAPGLSVKAEYEPLPQIGIFTDGDNMSVITQYPDTFDKLQYLDEMTSAAPYHFKQLNRILVIGAGGGADVLQAKYHRIAHIDAIELNPQIVHELKTTYAEFSGDLYNMQDVNVHIGEARSFLSGNHKRYDLIQIALLDAFSASASGLYALNEGYLYTVEAMKQYINHLNPDGYLAMTRWIKLPPRDSLKLVATVLAALEQNGTISPKQQIALIRSWQTSTLIVKNGQFTDNELGQLQKFCSERAFDIGYTPTINPDQVNQFNILSEPMFYTAISAILNGQQEQFLSHYKFNLRPATDDRPYFHHFFKWGTFSEIFRLRQQGGMSLIEWGYIVLVVTLFIAVIFSIGLILLPLWAYRSTHITKPVRLKRSAIFYYFFAIGLAFLFIEIAFIQKFTLFLHHPITTIAVVLTAFLIFAGLGSLSSGNWLRHFNSHTVVTAAVAGITLFGLSYQFLLDPLFVALTASAVPLKIVLVVILIAPLAFCMGMPFPAGLDTLSKHASQFIPWAWGINGCASVISAVLATLLAIHFGFSTVILIAVLLYLTICIVHPGLTLSRGSH